MSNHTPTQARRRPGDGSKVAGAGWDILSREKHHWWPKGLSKFWADHEGLVSRLSHSGELIRSAPENFGALANAHAIKLNGPWNGTIEPIFGYPDTNLPGLVASILNAHSALNGSAPGPSRVKPYLMAREDRDAFAEGLASLVVRSPAFRDRIRLSTNSSRQSFGQPDIGERDNLIALNMHHWYSNVVADFRRAHFVLLYSCVKEFIFGEGYLNNVSGPTHTFNLRAAMPLTPELAVVCFSGSGRVPRANICSLLATEAQVSAINELTQIYTKDYVFFRSQQPDILNEFGRNEFLERPNHQDAEIESIISTVRSGSC